MVVKLVVSLNIVAIQTNPVKGLVNAVNLLVGIVVYNLLPEQPLMHPVEKRKRSLCTRKRRFSRC